MKVSDLEVYQRLCVLVLTVHKLTLTFPKFERYELGSQVRRSSNAIPANLAEGFDNKHVNIYLECISRAQGELRETVHHLTMVYRKGYCTRENIEPILQEYDVCGRMLTRLEQSLRYGYRQPIT